MVLGGRLKCTHMNIQQTLDHIVNFTGIEVRRSAFLEIYSGMKLWDIWDKMSSPQSKHICSTMFQIMQTNANNFCSQECSICSWLTKMKWNYYQITSSIYNALNGNSDIPISVHTFSDTLKYVYNKIKTPFLVDLSSQTESTKSGKLREYLPYWHFFGI